MASQNHFDAIALLRADHRKVEDLFAEFEAAKGDERKKALAAQAHANKPAPARRPATPVREANSVQPAAKP